MGTTIHLVINRLYFLYAVLVFILPLPLVLVAHVIAKVFPEKERLLFIYRVHRAWIKFWEMGTGIHFRISGQEHLDPDQAYVLVCNHCNILDIPCAGSMILHPWKSLVKAELLKVPFVGWIIGQISIPVDRSDKASRQASLRSMTEELHNGISILIFPEGTRNRTGQPLKSFYPGAFNTAITAQVPILPMVLTGTRTLQPVGTIEFYPGIGDLTILPPVATDGYTESDTKLLMERVKTIMEAAIVEQDPIFQPTFGMGEMKENPQT